MGPRAEFKLGGTPSWNGTLSLGSKDLVTAWKGSHSGELKPGQGLPCLHESPFLFCCCLLSLAAQLHSESVAPTCASAPPTLGKIGHCSREASQDCSDECAVGRSRSWIRTGPVELLQSTGPPRNQIHLRAGSFHDCICFSF
jgi:hypothetical protein